jgi:DNA ligase-1
MKPLLAASFDLEILEQQLADLDYPMIGSPKIDGYRGLIDPTRGLLTRRLIDWPNRWVAEKMREHHVRINYFDGELVIGTPFATGKEEKEVFKRSNPLMRHWEEVDFTYYVFDQFMDPDTDYSERLVQLERGFPVDLPWLKFLEPKLIESAEEALSYEAECLAQGYEGIMLRSVDGPYKFGRSTLRQQILIKLKRTVDCEAQIVGFEQRMRNDNEIQIDELGYSRRSSHKENLTPLDMLGAFILKSPSFEKTFNIGSGFDHYHATKWWQERDTLLGKWITFKYIPHGTYERPRHPIFLGFRED